jgi:hypothetical protein
MSVDTLIMETIAKLPDCELGEDAGDKELRIKVADHNSNRVRRAPDLLAAHVSQQVSMPSTQPAENTRQRKEAYSKRIVILCGVYFTLLDDVLVTAIQRHVHATCCVLTFVVGVVMPLVELLASSNAPRLKCN